jgi:hypothetical protein
VFSSNSNDNNNNNSDDDGEGEQTLCDQHNLSPFEDHISLFTLRAYGNVEQLYTYIYTGCKEAPLPILSWE